MPRRAAVASSSADPIPVGSPALDWDAHRHDYAAPAYAWYVVGVLTLAYLFSFLDRQIIAFLIPAIRRDFNLGNFEIGLLQGTSFAIFYTFFGLPLGRFADTRSRRGLIAAGFVLWSVMTAASGLAQRFWHLVLCRTGVAVGEAALSPAAYSLISDYFPPERRATAIGVYSFGIYLGSGLSLVSLGFIVEFLEGRTLSFSPLAGEVQPWQAVFFLVGLPGALLALTLLTVREAPRHGVARPMPLEEVVGYLWAHRGPFLSLFLGMASLTFAGYANSNWMVLFFKARHGWPEAHTGLVLGIITALGGALGAIGGGRFSDALRRRGRTDAELLAAGLGAVLFLPASVLYALGESGTASAAWMAFQVTGFSAAFALVAATVQQIAPPPMRAQCSALFLFVINLLGMGFGPAAAGWLGRGFPSGAESEWLPRALLITQLAGGVGGILFFAAGLKACRRIRDGCPAGGRQHP